jgi:hypothetical protein
MRNAKVNVAAEETDVYKLEFPPADAVAGARALDYEIAAVPTAGGKPVVRYVVPEGFNMPLSDKRVKENVQCLVSSIVLPKAGTFRFEVRPRNSFGKTGAALTCEV